MAYAVVVSLKQTLEPLLDSARSRFQNPNSELKPIYDQLCYVKSFLDKMISLEDSNTVGDLEKQIKDVVQNAQDLIESHLSDLVHSGSEISEAEGSVSGFSGELVEVNRKLGSFIKMLKAKEDHLTGVQQSTGLFAAVVAVSSRIDFGNDNKIVGFEDELLGLLDRLHKDNSSRRVIISIVGMAGIGKTTLAKVAYLHPLNIEHFDICLFVEIGVEYELKILLLHLLDQLGFNIEEMRVGKNERLGKHLHKYLRGRRYLVVLDDIWDIRVWYELQLFFPDNQNGSAIIWTSRLTNVVRNACVEENILQKRFLNDDESWNLLREITFSDMEMKICPSELEEIGKTIATKLGGLPLAIVEIGKLISKSPKTVENWMAVAQDISPLIERTTIPEILHLSYAQLPQHLKACFLYLGLFQLNFKIPTSQLFRLWVAEGFMEPVADDKSLEQKAEEYLEDLVSRSLVVVHELSSIGRIKACRIHQLLQDLCVTEARQQKLFHIVDECTTSFSQGTRNQRRLGIQSDLVQVMESVSAVRSLVYMSPQRHYPLQVFVRSRWLKVLHALSIRYCKFPNEVLKLVRLKYLAITFDGELPSSISRLWNLEVLIIHPTHTINSSVFLPLEVWELQKLRHLVCMGFDLPDPSTGHGNDLYLTKLLTVSGVSGRTCTEGVLARIPNLIKLGIQFNPTDHTVDISCFHAVKTHLHHLESFKCAVMNQSEAAFSQIGCPSCLRELILPSDKLESFPYHEDNPHGADSLERLIRFPRSLKKLNLEIQSQFCWEHILYRIGELPLLKKLTLKCGTFKEGHWETIEGQFPSLKFLAVCGCMGLQHWTIESSHFPCLERLLLYNIDELVEIPLDFVDIPTLSLIIVNNCSESVVFSAKRILEEQEELYGEEGALQVQVMLTGMDVALESLASHNFRFVKD